MTKKSLGTAAMNVVTLPMAVLSLPLSGLGKVLKCTASLMEKKTRMAVSVYGSDGHYKVACTGNPRIRKMNAATAVALKELFGEKLEFIKFIPRQNPDVVNVVWDKESITKKVETGVLITADADGSEDTTQILRNILRGIREAMLEEERLIRNSKITVLKL